MRDFQACIAGPDFVDLTIDPAQTRRGFVFEAGFRHKLHADADTKERTGIRFDSLDERIERIEQAIRAAGNVTNGAD